MRPNLPESVPAASVLQVKGRIQLTGLVITRQRPGTASGVVFLKLA